MDDSVEKPARLTQTLRYLRDCLAVEVDQSRLWNLTSLAPGDRVFLDAFPLAGEESRWRLPVAASMLQAFADHDALGRCHEVVLGAYFLVARVASYIDTEISYRTIAAPLLLARCHILEAQKQSVSMAAFHLNERLLRELRIPPDGLRGRWMEDPFSEVSRKILAGGLAQSGIRDTKALAMNRELAESVEFGDEDLQTVKPRLVRSLALLKAFHSRRSAGISHEISQLARSIDNRSVAPPLRVFLSGDGNQRFVNPVEAEPANVPGSFNQSQVSAVNNAVNFVLSVVHGGAGTGKSEVAAAQAIEHAIAGQNTLIVASNQTSLDVINARLQKRLGDQSEACIRAGQGSHRRELAMRLRRLLRERPLESVDPDDLASQLRGVQQGILTDESELSDLVSMAEAEYAWVDGRDPVSRWKKWRARRTLRRSDLLIDKAEQLIRSHGDRSRLIRRLCAARQQLQIGSLLASSRNSLVAFASELEKGQPSLRGWQMLARVFPVWMVTLDDLADVLPIEVEFDLVIFDDASGIRLPEAVPALQRGRRAVVLGDHWQVQPTARLSRRKDLQLRRRYGMLIQKDFLPSLLELAEGRVAKGDQVVHLTEHFRGTPRLSAYSDEAFYRGALQFSGARPAADQSAWQHLVVNGRLEDGVNAAEADRIVAAIADVVEASRQLPDYHAPSIGVISFIPSQARYIEHRCLQTFGLIDIHRHALRSGTPRQYHGHERDVVFLSCAVDSESGIVTLDLLDDSGAFNTAITRARNRMVVCTSIPANELPGDSCLRRYLHHMERLSDGSMATPRRSDHPVAGALEDLGLRCFEDFVVSGTAIDLVAVFGDQCLAIDLIGFPGGRNRALPLERYRVYQAAGIQVVPLTLMEWKHRKDEWLGRIPGILSIDGGEFQVLDGATTRRLLWVRSELVQRGLDTRVERVDRMVEAMRAVERVLDHKLNAGELTHRRYQASARQAFSIALSSLECDIESLQARELVQLEPGEAASEHSMSLCDDVEAALRRLAARLASAQFVPRKTAEPALDDLRRLTDQVDLYGD